jgi:hypothetical protein
MSLNFQTYDFIIWASLKALFLYFENIMLLFFNNLRTKMLKEAHNKLIQYK